MIVTTKREREKEKREREVQKSSNCVPLSFSVRFEIRFMGTSCFNPKLSSVTLIARKRDLDLKPKEIEEGKTIKVYFVPLNDHNRVKIYI